jgi:hypothetical protein
VSGDAINPDTARIWHKVFAVLQATSLFFLIGAAFSSVGVWRLIRGRSVTRWNAVALGICATIVILGVLLGCYEVYLCANGRHSEEKPWHMLLGSSVLLEAMAAFSLFGDATGRRWAAVSTAFGLVFVQLAVFLTFEITLNGFG